MTGQTVVKPQGAPPIHTQPRDSRGYGVEPVIKPYEETVLDGIQELTWRV